MAIDRRHLLIGSIAAVSAPVGAWRVSAADEVSANEIAFVAAAKRADERFCVVLLSRDGRIVRELPLSARGHDVAVHAQSGQAVVFARRPGTFAVGFDVRTSREPHIFTASEGRHFYGHGAFSQDGRLLYVTENDIAGARGVIGIYDAAARYKKIGEHPSHGLGPHEILLLGDGKTLAVANGGLDTVPGAGRITLNTHAMQPSLTFVDSVSGALVAKHTLTAELQRLSIRHIAADAAGRVWFGAQWEGDQANVPQLIGWAARDSGVQLIAPDASFTVDLKGYVGSMAASRDGSIIAASAPKAGRVVYIDAATQRISASSVLKDACGIAGEGGEAFAATSGFGVLRHERAGQPVMSETRLSDIAFDNHLRMWG